jgi:hypothetical protein
MDERALICAAQITLRRAILERFPPGPERDKRLEWLARTVSGRQEAMRALMLLRQGSEAKGKRRGSEARSPHELIDLVKRGGVMSRGERESASHGEAIHSRRATWHRRRANARKTSRYTVRPVEG